ncbi:sigma-70 family RNA polymerase sigma factor [Actinoplanes sp. CA-030573]|uniref:sigma-70 family RNA polymerase sigma factor n=1 Tax=Actinoplanes sp. CA-030573 TaxID=3239898 RepID=UPI003D90A9C2
MTRFLSRSRPVCTTMDAIDEATTLTDAFERERRGLLAHAYRMLGVRDDAEDVVQETYLRALRGWPGFDGRASVRTWLYRIATNACLTALDGRKRRALPSSEAVADAVDWVGPFPADPADSVTAREGVRLAFIAGIQHLPPRQRAVLLLREVLAFSAAETGEILELSVPAVKSALQRARARMDAVAPAATTCWSRTTPARASCSAATWRRGRRPTRSRSARSCGPTP